MLSGKTFYHGTTKKAIVAFGNLFNDIHIERPDATGTKIQHIKVPIAYGPKEKYLAREEQQIDLDVHRARIVLPRLAFEITSFQRDSSRQFNPNMRNNATVAGSTNRQYAPVPYNLEISLYALTKTQDDGLQIMEQILPMFNPTYTLTLNAIPDMAEKIDLPITLQTVTHTDNYDAAFNERREVIWQFNFMMMMNYYGPVDKGVGVIKKIEIDIFGNKQMTEGITHINSEVVPFEANRTDAHTILTTIEGF